MAEAAVIAAAATHVSSSYRVKFRKKQFLELVEVAKPKIMPAQPAACLRKG